MPQLAKEMLAHALRWRPAQTGASGAQRLFFRNLSHLCQDWFSTPRILWVPSAKSDEVIPFRSEPGSYQPGAHVQKA